MTPAISEWPNRIAAVENVFVIVGFTWNTYFLSIGFSKSRSPGGYRCLWNLAPLAPYWTSVEKSWEVTSIVSTTCIFTCIYFIPSTIGSHSLYVMCCSSATTTLLIVRTCVAILKGCLTLPPGKVAHRPSLVESLTVLLPPCCVLSSTPWVWLN